MSLPRNSFFFLAVLLVLTSLISGCAAPAPLLPTATLAPTATEIAVLPSATNTLSPTATSTRTPVAPTVTQTLTTTPFPSETPTTSPTATATNQAPATATRRPGAALPGGSGSGVFVYMIVQNGGGKDGCGDTVKVAVPIQRSKDTGKDIEAALDMLFTMKSKYYGNLYNPVSYSTLRVQDVEFTDSGGLTVWLSGKYKPTGNDCDNILVKSQIWSTAKQFGGISGTAFYINGPHPFGDFVSNDK